MNTTDSTKSGKKISRHSKNSLPSLLQHLMAKIQFPIPSCKKRVNEFDKLLMASTTPDQSDYFLSVSNRQKTSGVRFDPATGREFNRFLGSATSVNESGYEEVLKELHKMEKEAAEAEPKLALPSSSSVHSESP